MLNINGLAGNFFFFALVRYHILKNFLRHNKEGLECSETDRTLSTKDHTGLNRITHLNMTVSDIYTVCQCRVWCYKETKSAFLKVLDIFLLVSCQHKTLGLQDYSLLRGKFRFRSWFSMPLLISVRDSQFYFVCLRMRFIFCTVPLYRRSWISEWDHEMVLCS